MLTEAREQALLIQWADLKKFSGNKILGHYLFAIPNGGKRHFLEAVNLKRQGVRSGIPDIMIFIPNKKYHGLFIEMKRKTKYQMGTNQHLQVNRLISMQYCARVAAGFEKAVEIIEEYLTEL